MSQHPYVSAPARAFWSKGVARNWQPSEAVQASQMLVRHGEKVMSAGSCFAANLVPYLEGAGFTYVRTERPHKAFGAVAAENLSYDKFSAAYGNIYTARQIKQLLLRALGRFRPAEDRWPGKDGITDPFRPGLRHKARSDAEFDALTRQHLARTLQAFSEADVLIYTLGLTEAWTSCIDGAVFPACPGTVAGSFDAKKHVFHNFSVAETAQDLGDFLELLRDINPRVRVILTVSPVPLVATATSQHVLVATTYSKSVLRVAAQETVLRHHGVTYFPAYEIVTGPQAPESFFTETRRDVSRDAIDVVMGAFFATCEDGIPAPPRPAAEQSRPQSASFSRGLIEAECEEAFADRGAD
ncbi:GSCFA domain-containing protein [Plastoroseomonas hellenica]|uniref:GSCFA domain-containing protein n=1 Tax=Plastoroseomonas hellenica TaxID=2687306 RepID=UPI001BA742EE|nr:GSCFA domain-containing protein [Plastoroseomonas hellenica]MBR0644714.1 GSCFA domain-containing protein [Plastoroseomonas hellenica]